AATRRGRARRTRARATSPCREARPPAVRAAARGAEPGAAVSPLQRETPWLHPSGPAGRTANHLWSKALCAHERDESARDGAGEGRAFRRPAARLEDLATPAPDRDDEPAERRELVVEGRRRRRRRGRDGDPVERRVLRETARSVADVHVHAVAVA